MRGAGFALAAGTIAAALFAGSVLRDPGRAAMAPPSGAPAQTDKDQTRVSVEGRRALAPQGEDMGNGRALESVEAEPGGDWQEQEFAFVEVLDGRTVRSGDVTITLAGIELPQPDQVCRTLDDRLEPCAARATTQLELLTRSRRLACRYRMTTSSAGVGSCRLGARDLGERMLRTGYVSAGGRAVVANVADTRAR